MTEQLTPLTQKYLRQAGWFPDRDISDHFVFSPQKILFPEALTIFKEFGCLDIRPSDPYPAKLQFDIDDSACSRQLRRKNSRLPETGSISQSQIQKSSPFFNHTATFLDTATIESIELERFLELKTPSLCPGKCTYLGYIDNIEGTWLESDMYITEAGGIYLPEANAGLYRSFPSFLNAMLDNSYRY